MGSESGAKATTGLVTVMKIGAEGRGVAVKPLKASFGFIRSNNTKMVKPSMVDTSSSVNILSVKLARELGLRSKDRLPIKGPQKVTSFNNYTENVLGYHKVQTQFKKEVKELIFAVVPGASDQPLIGMPGLMKMGIEINCKERIISLPKN